MTTTAAPVEVTLSEFKISPATINVPSGQPVVLNVTNGGTSLAAAAVDQLGLKFERGREVVDVLVIDSAELPLPD